MLKKKTIELAYREEKALVEAEAYRVDEANKHKIQVEYAMALERSHSDDPTLHSRPPLPHGNSFDSKFKKMNHHQSFPVSSSNVEQHSPPASSSIPSTLKGSLLHAAGSWHHILPSHIGHNHNELKHHSSLKVVKEEQDNTSQHDDFLNFPTFIPSNESSSMNGGVLLNKRTKSDEDVEASPTPTNSRRILKRSNSHELPPSHPERDNVLWNHSVNLSDLMNDKFHLSHKPIQESLLKRSKSPHILMHLQYLLHGQRAALFFAPTKTVQHTHEIWEV